MARAFTVGHSTRSFDELLLLLRAHGVVTLVDVRSTPKSRRHPHFNDDALALALPEAGVAYVPLRALGGRRKARADSTNMAWRNESFRGYADYMQTEPFARGLAELEALAASTTLAFMCAEAVPWRCHRSLIADALVAHGVDVLHITSPTKAAPHKLTPFARVDAGAVTYPALV